MHANIEYQPATEADCQAIADFNIALASETEGKQLNPLTVAQGVRSLMGRPEAGFYVVARAGGQTVACLMITFEWSDWRNAFFWWIQSVYVRPDYRRRGVFTGLFRHVQSLITDREDVCGLRLYVEQDNAAAQQTYRSLGMSDTSYLFYEYPSH